MKKKFSFDSLHISDDVDFSTILSFVCMNQGVLFEGSFWRVIFWVILEDHFGGWGVVHNSAHPEK